MTDNEIGNSSENRVACPGFERIRTTPPTVLAMSCTTSSPTPRPEISVTASLVEKPGRKRNSSSSASFKRAAISAEASPLRMTFSRSLAGSTPRPSSVTVIWSVPALWRASRRIRPLASLPSRTRSSGGSIA